MVYCVTVRMYSTCVCVLYAVYCIADNIDKEFTSVIWQFEELIIDIFSMKMVHICPLPIH